MFSDILDLFPDTVSPAHARASRTVERMERETLEVLARHGRAAMLDDLATLEALAHHTAILHDASVTALRSAFIATVAARNGLSVEDLGDTVKAATQVGGTPAGAALLKVMVDVALSPTEDGLESLVRMDDANEALSLFYAKYTELRQQVAASPLSWDPLPPLYPGADEGGLVDAVAVSPLAFEGLAGPLADVRDALFLVHHATQTMSLAAWSGPDWPLSLDDDQLLIASQTARATTSLPPALRFLADLDARLDGDPRQREVRRLLVWTADVGRTCLAMAGASTALHALACAVLKSPVLERVARTPLDAAVWGEVLGRLATD